MAERLTGTVTFLFTDVEGSTQLLGALGPDRYGAALADHRAIVRDAVSAHGGVEDSTQGDSFVVAFRRASDAVGAAIDAQRELAAHAWPEGHAFRVRMGIHTTEITDVSQGYVGMGVHQGARIGAAGHGGQVLVSQAAADLVRDEAGVELRDLGEHRLRGLPHPEHLYQLVISGLADSFPALKTASGRQTNLPQPLTRFIGRERELNAVRSMAVDDRLVTLVGVGGTGKTRLMLEAAATLVDVWPDGVWLAELAPIKDPDLVPGQVARALGLQEEPQRPPADTLVDFLATKALLLLFDNCEHLIGATADLVLRLLTACPRLRVVCTSREALGLDGEAVYQVPSLGLPSLPGGDSSLGDAPSLEALRQAEAVRLFVDRARAVAPAFDMTDANARTVVDICRRLDGIPLAIELAAARVRVLSVEEINAGMGDRFRLLSGGRRGALPRQQTLGALIDWSWDLLDAADQSLFARLAVFAAGWSLDAAAAVVGDGDRPSTLDGLARLVDRSLVIAEPGIATRYRMLETIRQYARDRLVASGDIERIRGAHLRYYLEMGLAAEKELMGPDMIAWLARLDAEIDELRAALDWGLEVDPERAIRLTVALLPYWRARALGSEALEVIIRAAAAAEALPPPAQGQERERDVLVSRILASAAHAQSVWGVGTLAPRYAERAVAIARRAGDRKALSEALGAEGMAAVFSGHLDHALEMHDTVIALATELGDAWTVAMVEAGAAMLELAHGDLAAAERRQAAATEMAMRSGNPFVISFAALNSGRLAGWAGRGADVRRWFAEAIRHYQELGDLRFVLAARSELAHALRRLGELDEAAAIYRETVREWARLGSRGAIANQLESIAFLAAARGDPERAARLLGAAERIREEGGSVMLGNERVEYDDFLPQLQTALDPDRLAAAWAEGRALGQEEAVRLAAS